MPASCKKPKKGRKISRAKIRSAVRTVRNEQRAKPILSDVDVPAPESTATGSGVIVFHIASDLRLTTSAPKVKQAKAKKKATAKKARKRKVGTTHSKR